MINLRNDYSSVAHEKILKALLDYNNKTYIGYGMDEVTEEAKAIIKKEIGNENVDIHFLPGGTVTNKVFISHVLKPYECVICCDEGHINVHETGTIEQSGHKVLTVPTYDGKVSCDDVLKVFSVHNNEHMVKPKLLYISNPTELGTIYSKKELIEISKLCKKCGMYLYVDGARLGTALTAKTNDLDIKELTKLVDAFYIGGTKNGLLLGEALVIVNDELKQNVRYSIKQSGGMYSKGFVNGIQFKVLFEENLFYEIGRIQNKLAEKLYNGLLSIGVNFISKQVTNQIFPVFDNKIIKELEKHFSFEMWEVGETKSTIRFITTYKHTEEDIDNIVNIINSIINK